LQWSLIVTSYVEVAVVVVVVVGVVVVVAWLLRD
jgi:hypothetical protein